MQRELKFRAWIEKVHKYDWRENIQEKIMREVRGIEFPTNRANFERMQIVVWTKGSEKPVETYFDGTDEFVVMQFTGLKDKNGKEIYEGDIVNLDCYSYEEPESTCFGEIVYSDGNASFCMKDCEQSGKWIPLCEIGGSYITIIEVMGNIYENPELLEGSNP